MRRSRFVLFLLALCLTLAACGSKEPAPFDPEADSKALLEADGAFTGELEEIDQSTACAIYGIDESTVTGAKVYMGNTGVSLEELAIFTLADSDAAQAALTALEYRIEDQRDSAAGYAGFLQGELSKLDGALTRIRGNSVLLAVAADYGPVNDFLGD